MTRRIKNFFSQTGSASGTTAPDLLRSCHRSDRTGAMYEPTSWASPPPPGWCNKIERERKRGELHSRPPWHQLDKQSMLQRPLYNLQRYSVSGPRMIGGPDMSKRVPSRETSTCSPGLHIYYGKNPEIYEVFYSPRFRNKQESNYSLKIVLRYLSVFLI